MFHLEQTDAGQNIPSSDTGDQFTHPLCQLSLSLLLCAPVLYLVCPSDSLTSHDARTWADSCGRLLCWPSALSSRTYTSPRVTFHRLCCFKETRFIGPHQPLAASCWKEHTEVLNVRSHFRMSQLKIVLFLQHG